MVALHIDYHTVKFLDDLHTV